MIESCYRRVNRCKLEVDGLVCVRRGDNASRWQQQGMTEEVVSYLSSECDSDEDKRSEKENRGTFHVLLYAAYPQRDKGGG